MESPKDCVYVSQEHYGLIIPKEGPQNIGTFGCGPCIGGILKHPNCIACFHVSNPRLVNNGFRTMLYIMMRLLNDNEAGEHTIMYLIGGRDNEQVKQAILNIVSEKQFSCLQISIGEDYARGIEHKSSIMASFEHESLTSYIPTGHEKICVDEILCFALNPHAQMKWCYNPEYPCDTHVIAYGSRKPKLLKYSSDDSITTTLKNAIRLQLKDAIQEPINYLCLHPLSPHFKFPMKYQKKQFQQKNIQMRRIRKQQNDKICQPRKI